MKTTEPKMRKKTGILTGDDIKELNIIDSDFNEDSLKIASYDFRLGDICYKSVNNRDKVNFEKINLTHNNGVLEIPKFSAVIITSKEIVNLPENVVGRFDMRVKYALQGLILQVGPQLEPKSYCSLYGLLLNFSNKDIYLKAGEPLMTAEFSFIDIENLSEKFKRPSCQPELEEILKSNCFNGNLSTCFNSFKEMDEKLQKDFNEIKSQCNDAEKKLANGAKQQMMFMSILYPIVLTIILPFLCVYITKVSVNKADYPYEEIIQMRKQHESLNQKYESINTKIIQMKDPQNRDSIQPGLKNVESVDKNKLQDL